MTSLLQSLVGGVLLVDDVPVIFHLLMAESHKPSDTLALTVCSYNCSGFNSSKKSYISKLLNYLCTGVSGFDNSEVLSGLDSNQ